MELTFFTSGDLTLKVPVTPDQETVWLTQDQIAELYDTTQQNISQNVASIISDEELKIAMKELSETRIWLRLIGEAGYIENAKLADLLGESRELSRILSASVTTAKKKIRG